MEGRPYTVDDEIRDTRVGKPHVVILGAGASLAATPEGDANGNRLPVMNNFVEVVGLDSVLETYGIAWKPGDNFEVLYATLADDPTQVDALNHIEATVEGYLRSLRLPKGPTIYDKLVLSMRPKDLIATFNWDPFLYEACYRNRLVAGLPNVIYLHGSVATGYCLEHYKKGPPGAPCSVCRKPFARSRLLFPISKKNYNEDPFLRVEWRTLESFLAHAFQLTFFGYGAPSSDLEAVAIMKKAWGHIEQRALEQTEIIDIRDEDELAELWKPFIHSDHYEVHRAFSTSWLAKHPRRTCEAAWQQYMECQFLHDHTIPDCRTLEDLQVWFRPLVDAERSGT